MRDLATKAQAKYICSLARELGYDLDEYDFETMTKEQASELIDMLREELEG